ncbi:TadE family protein [Sphingomonas cavernae]|uniref:Pilus assembly protein n=1 Tax=Sphingomonas cavernae TaxID=2320861 RepID=A0A418WMX7_9SPHN|nr:TadE family protein [Sphingomonas cavernae]RJF91347.1 pilus assembly protein [Sphingomonas cavernae]
MIAPRRTFPALTRNTDGATVVEFAIVAPIMLMLMLGMMELGYQAYAQSVLQGATNKAARDLTLEDAPTKKAVIEGKIASMLQTISNRATVTTTSESFSSFTKVNTYEDFKDLDGDKQFDADTECFLDVNNSKTWNKRGKSGLGGADDIVVFTATATYPRLFPVMGMLGWSNTGTSVARTTLRNQPYSQQAEETGVEICPKPA